ncbi:MAG: hypothetical protein HS103_13635 [Anaerolineales bacterium]|nr:hypothetical protein [Anaerolineales bacterium]
MSFQDNRAGELILLAVAVVLGGGLIGALVFGAAAASYNWAAAMVGGIEGDLRKVSARVEVTESYRPRSFQTIIPMDTTITPPRKMKVAPRDGQAQPEPPMTPEERRKFHDRLYRIERYYRMQRRRLEIRDE